MDHVVAERRSDRASSLVAGAHLIADRLSAGGRLLVRGDGRAAADARHVAVEFLHPVIVGRKALPARLGGAGADRTDLVMALAYGGTTVDGRVDLAIADHPVPQAEVQIDLPAGPGDSTEAEAKRAAVLSYHVLWELTHTFLAETSQSLGSGGAMEALYPMLYDNSGGASGQAGDSDGEALASAQAKLDESEAVRSRALAENDAAISTAAEIVAASRTVFTFGNGGSETDAEDLAFALGPKGHALSSDVATVTALANDVSFDVVFARPIVTLGGPSDSVVGLSTSGTSSNVLAGLAQARKSGLRTIGLAGYDGGAMAHADLDALMVVASDSVHRIQEAQVALYCEVVRRAGVG